MSEQIAVVFTAKSIERITEEGGTAAWRLNRNHARRCSFVVCTRNAHADWVEGPEPHRSAFLIGRVSGVVPCRPTPENAEAPNNRFLIQFSEFARIEIPDFWEGDRNPITYRSLEDLPLDLSTLKWEAMPEPNTASADSIETVNVQTLHGQALTMAEAKRGLALSFGVAPDAIEITIRG